MISNELITIREVHSVNVISYMCDILMQLFSHHKNHRFRGKKLERKEVHGHKNILLHTLNLSFPVVVLCMQCLFVEERETLFLMTLVCSWHHQYANIIIYVPPQIFAVLKILFNFFQHLKFPCFGTCEIFPFPYFFAKILTSTACTTAEWEMYLNTVYGYTWG